MIDRQKAKVKERMHISSQKKAVREVVRDWPLVGHDVRSLKRLDNCAARHCAAPISIQQLPAKNSLATPNCDFSSHSFATIFDHSWIECLRQVCFDDIRRCSFFALSLSDKVAH